MSHVIRLGSAVLVLLLLASGCREQPAVQQKGAPAGTPAVQQKGSGFRGNPASKVYHNSGCRYFNSKGASKTFATQQEAVKAGYRPCKVCNG